MCRRAIVHCSCMAVSALPQTAGKVRILVESKRRGGKTVTAVRGLALDGDALSQLAKALRTACGSGGTVKDGAVEVQGDHYDQVASILSAQGLLR